MGGGGGGWESVDDDFRRFGMLMWEAFSDGIKLWYTDVGSF